jgi:hypothetical protein
MNPFSIFAEVVAIDTIIGIVLAFTWVIMTPRLKPDIVPKDISVEMLLCTIFVIWAIIFGTVLTSGVNKHDGSKAEELYLENIITSVGVTIFGPIYIAAIGTLIAKRFRKYLPWRKTFMRIVIAALVIYLVGYWYGGQLMSR